MGTLSKICYTEELKQRLLEVGYTEKDFFISLEEILFERYSVKGKVEFYKRIQLQALMNKISIEQLKEVLEEKGFSKDASTKWFLGINPFPHEAQCQLLDKLTLEERFLYFRALEKYNKLLSKGKGVLSNDEKKKRRDYVYKCKAIFDIEKYELCEDQESIFYIEEIKEKFVTLSKKEKYMVVNFFHVYVAIPFESLNFAIKYAKLNALGKWLLRRAMKKLMCDKGEAILKTEKIAMMEEILKVDKSFLDNAIKNSDENELEKLFHEKLSYTNFHEKLFFEDMEIYPQIEVHEWKMIIDFVKLGNFYNPVIQNFSESQKKIDQLAEILRQDFCLGYKL